MQNNEPKQAEQRFHQLVENAPHGIVMVNREGKIQLVNRQIEKSFGYRRDELLGQAIEILVPERFRAHHPSERRGFMQAPTTRPMGAGRDLFGLRKDGSEFPVEIGLSPFETDQGVMILGTIVDITERKRAETALRQSEERLQTVIENLTEGLIIAEPDGKLIHWNRAALVMHGFVKLTDCLVNLTEFERMFEIRTLDGTVLSFEQFPLPRILRGEHLQDYELCVRRTDTEWERIFSYGGAIAREPGGNPLAFLTITDITERKRAEEALKKQAAKLREQAQILDLAHVLVSDMNERIVFWNTGAEQLYGWRTEEALGHEPYALLQTEFPQPRAAIEAELFDNGHWEGELVHTRRDGTQVVVASHWVLHKNEQDEPVAIVQVNNDITELKRAENALRRSQEQLAGIIGSAMDAIITVDDRQQIILFNDAAEKMFRHPAKEALGKPLDQFIPRRYRDAHRNHIRNFGQTHVTRRSMASLGAIFGLRSDGEEFPIEASISQLESEGRKFYTVILRDITERQRAEEQTRRLNETLEMRVAERTAELEAVNRELEAFSYSVSHDLRAPLRHINGFSQALLEDYEDKLDATAKSYLQEVRGASQEMSQLIDDVLQLARVTRNEMHREEVDLSELARAVAGGLQKREPRRRVIVDIQENLWAYGDRRLLRIMLDNLLGNAWKFTSKSEKPEIAFGRKDEDERAVYFVRDNGAGFDMAYADKLFGAFQRLHGGDEFDGTGIGLATVQRIVNRHGGRVWAEGEVGKGATFYFILSSYKGEET